ncbi:TolC family outer membrane protein [Tropicimonas sp. S265A]|uniref:TolC family outer membrane protein n=1 Tax=Tropicimonas sp. S265A TaxID=3415134 RepID=UPI003C7B30A7
MFIRTIRAAGLGLAIVATNALAAPAQTLTDTLVEAYKTSQLLEQNRALLRAADEDVALAVSRLRPVLDYIGSYTWSDNRDIETDNTGIGLSATWLLYDFGRSRLDIEASKEVVLATREALRDIEQDVLQLGVQAFLDVRLALETVDLRRNNVRVISEQLRAARDRFEVGEGTSTDVAQAEARLAEANSNLSLALGDLAAAREFYRAVTGAFPVNLARPPAAPSIPGSVEEASSIGVTRHPSILSAQRSVRASELTAESAQRGITPTINLQADVTRNWRDDASDSTDSALSLNLRGPIYQGGAISAQYRQALARTEVERAQLNQAVLDIRRSVGTNWANVQVARAVIEASVRQVEAAQIAFEGVQEQQRVGERTTLDVLDAEQELLDARTTQVSAEIAAVQSVYDLLRAMGLLTVDYLGLPVPTYDPSVYFNAVKDAPATSTQGARLDRVLESIGQQ